MATPVPGMSRPARWGALPHGILEPAPAGGLVPGGSMINVTMYSRRNCAMCREAKLLLESKGASVTEIEISGEHVMATAISTDDNRQELPQIFIGTTRIGGLQGLRTLDSSGELDRLLKRPLL